MPYKRTQKGQTRWVAQVQVNGKRECCLFTTKAEAIAWEVKMRSGSGLPPKKLSQETVSDSSVTLVKWAEDYLDFCQKYSLKVIDEKINVFRRFFKYVDPTMLVVDLKPKMVLDFLRIQGEERSGNASNKERKNLVAAWNWGVKYLDFPEKNPCRQTRGACRCPSRQTASKRTRRRRSTTAGTRFRWSHQGKNRRRPVGGNRRN